MSCCQGPSLETLTITHCGEETTTDVDGYLSAETRSRGDQDQCVVAKAYWSTRCWTAAVPQPGAQVSIGGTAYVINNSQYAPPCFLTLEVCRASLDCPDCSVSVYRLTRGTATELDCQEQLEQAEIVSGAGATICVNERTEREENGAIIQLAKATVCIDTMTQVLPGDYVVCGVDSWLVKRIISPCSAKCLLTIEAELDPYSVISLV